MKPEFKNITADYTNIPSLLSLALAICAGYFFQARYVVETVGNIWAARTISVLACVALAVLVKWLMRQIKHNERLDDVIERYVKPIVGLLLVIFAFVIDAMTSNASIENARVNNVAAKVAGSVNNSGIMDLREQRARDIKTLALLDSSAAKVGVFALARRRLELEKGIAEKSRLIAEAEKVNTQTVAQANNLLVGAVGIDSRINSALWGFYLMALVFGLEMFAPVVWHDSEKAIVRMIEHTDSVELSRRTVMTERQESIPIALPKPATFEDACKLLASGSRGVTVRGRALTIRNIADDYEVKKWRVEQAFGKFRSLPPRRARYDGACPDMSETVRTSHV